MSSRERGRYVDESKKRQIETLGTYEDGILEGATKLTGGERRDGLEDMSYTSRCSGESTDPNFDIINEVSAGSAQNTPNMPNSKPRKRW